MKYNQTCPQVLQQLRQSKTTSAMGVLQLTGKDNHVHFGEGAKLSATCPGDDAKSVKQFNTTTDRYDGMCTFLASDVHQDAKPTSQTPLCAEYPSGLSITGWLTGVLVTCASASLKQPCASTSPHHLPLFYCRFLAGTSQLFTGPAHARLQASEDAAGRLLGYETSVACPVPPGADVFNAFKSAGGYDHTMSIDGEHPRPATPALSPCVRMPCTHSRAPRGSPKPLIPTLSPCVRMPCTHSCALCQHKRHLLPGRRHQHHVHRNRRR